MGVLSEDIAAILLCIAQYLHPKSSHILYVQYKRVSSMFFNVLFYMGNVRSVCDCIAKNGRWKTVVPSEDIAAILQCSALYLHPKSSRALYVQYKSVSRMFLTLKYTFSKFILLGKSAYSLRYIAENARWKTSVLSKDIKAILLCTTLYLHPKSSLTLYVQYKRISSMFFNAILYF